MGKCPCLQLPRLGPEFVPLRGYAIHAGEGEHHRLQQVTTAARRRCAGGYSCDPPGPRTWATGPSSLRRLGEEASWPSGGRYLPFCLDEFERLEVSIREGRLPHELLDEIRHLIQHHPRIVLLFAGSHRPDEMELNWPDTLISTKLIRVSYLAEEEARQLITEPVPQFAVSYQPGSVERILEDALSALSGTRALRTGESSNAKARRSGRGGRRRGDGGR
jgi:hypothetical protein